VWTFDARSNVEGITKKDRPLTAKHFEQFEKCYGKDPNGQSVRTELGIDGRFRKFNIDEIKERDYRLDFNWLKDDALDDADTTGDPSVFATEAITELEFVVDELKEILNLLEAEKDGE
jgi:type I restriction enzyme M protein